jgi:hypothetical protein
MAYTLSYFINPTFVLDIFKLGALKLFAGLASNHNLPDRCLLSSCDYRHEPLASG